jgi:two-component system OmpR family response regulator
MTSGLTTDALSSAVDCDPKLKQSRHHNVDVLLVEDDNELAQQTASALETAGFGVRRAATLASAAVEISTKTPDLLILDRMLPDGEALDYLQSIRASKLEVPTLILSALGETQDRIQGLEHGADDYLAKPFDVYELVARVSALLRRATSLSREQIFNVGDLEMDIVNRTVLNDGEELVLQPREFKLLEYLVRNAGEVVTKAMLLKSVWGLEFDPQTNVVEVHISRLRAKLDRGREKKLLHTIRGNGYSLHC